MRLPLFFKVISTQGLTLLITGAIIPNVRRKEIASSGADPAVSNIVCRR